jgi:hypothetical protein
MEWRRIEAGEYHAFVNGEKIATVVRSGGRFGNAWRFRFVGELRSAESSTLGAAKANVEYGFARRAK